MGPKLLVGAHCKIQYGALSGFVGRIVGYDYTNGEVSIQLDKSTFATVPPTWVAQDEQLSLDLDSEAKLSREFAYDNLPSRKEG